MIRKIINKLLIIVIMVTMIIATIGQTMVRASKKTESISLALSKARVIKNGTSYEDKGAYALNTGSNHPIYQIVKLENGNKAGTNFLCVNATRGVTWNNNTVGTGVTYDTSYDLATDKSEIEGLTAAYNNVAGAYYTQIMWLLDNILIGDYTDSDVNSFLDKAGIVYVDKNDGAAFNGGPLGATYYFDETKIKAVNPNSAFADTDSTLYKQLYGNSYGGGGYYCANSTGAKEDIRLSKELIETVEQAAVWYFTNHGNTEFDCYTQGGVQASTISGINNGLTTYTDETTGTSSEAVVPKYFLRYADGSDWKLLANQTTEGVDNGIPVTAPTGAMLQEQASILYNYLVDAANKAAADGYTPQAKGTINIEYAGSSSDDKIVEDGDNYKVGPLKVTTTGNTTINGVTVKSGTNTISDVTLKKASNNDTITKPTSGENFYIIVKKSDVTGAINIKATATTSSIEKKLRIKEVTNDDQAEQAIVEVTPKSENIEKEIDIPLNKQFDLALRKTIVKIVDSNGTTKSIVNENGNSATRTINVDTSSIPDTATYKHRKDPVVIENGDIVTFRITIYNEGEIDGYASKIVDQLPTGLQSELSLNGTVTSHNGNVYKITAYDTTTNKIELTIDTAMASRTSIEAYSGSSVNNDYIELNCKVTGTANIDGTTKQYLTNIAYIAEEFDKDGNRIEADRDGNESKPTTSPNKTADQLKSADANDYKGKSSNKSVYSDTNNTEYYEGEEDDDDFEKLVILPKQFDLALRKFISKVSPDGNFNAVSEINPSRTPQVDTSKLKAGTASTATYNHSKEPIQLDAGDYILYTIRAYNEGDFDGYASEIVDYLPENIDFVESTDSYIKEINDKWTYDSATRKVTTNAATLSSGVPAPNATTKLKAFDAQTDDGHGSGLSYVDVQIVCKINKNAPVNRKLTNIAEITEYVDENGWVIPSTEGDRDSKPSNFPEDKKSEDTRPDYNGGTDTDTTDNYIPGQEDDDDFEKVIVRKKKIDLALTKFITAVSADDKIEDGEYLTPNKNIGSKTNEYIRATVADTTGLKNGTSTNATYTARKDIEPLAVNKNSYILYNIRVYNEGEVDVYAGKITDYLPENLEFVEGEFNNQYGWTANGQTVETTYLSSANGEDKILKAFDKVNDDGKGSGMDYKDLPILCKVSDKAESGKKMVNTAEITKYEDENGNEIPEDEDSKPNNKEEKNVEERDQDDDDYEVIVIKEFDLALRKFITEIDTLKTQEDENASPVTNFGREPKLTYENEKITYTHPKDVLRTTVGDIVTYTLRVYNEGDIAGFAQEITDDIPEYLEFLPENATNREYKWVMYDKDGNSTTKVSEAVKIKTDYTSKSNGEILMENGDLTENPNLLKAFDKKAGITDTNPDFVDVKVAFKVKDPNSNKTVIVNKAQISDDADEEGNPVEDVDSIPDKWNDGEDDQDYENVAVDYFDLSLLKYVTKAIVTENGKTKTTKTGNNGSDKDITPKVEVYRKSLNKTIVKFEYTIKITNEGDIAGYAKEITDYVPKGLKFFKEDNKGWKDEGNNVISTKLLKDTLLQPGQSATVKVILRWVNGEKNLGVKTNVAEISEDYNEKGVPDRDSTPDNKKPKEDDIDDAPVLLTISTGMLEHTIQYVTGALVILVILGLGIVVIKKYVL